MTEAIIVAIITAIATIAGQYMVNRRKNADTLEADAKREQIINDKLENIEKKLDIHNGYAEKFGQIEIDIAVIKNELKNISEGVKGK